MDNSARLATSRRMRDVVYAGFWRRGAALAVDQILLLGALYFLVFDGFIPWAQAAAVPREKFGVDLLALVALYLLVLVPLYHAGMVASGMQATLGKRALGIKVTDASGKALGFSSAFGRCFASTTSYLTLGIGFVIAAFDERKRALHDRLVDTLVVDCWAFTEHADRQLRRPHPMVLVFLAVLVTGVASSPKLYQAAAEEYLVFSIRPQFAEAVRLCESPKQAVAEFYSNLGKLPPDNASAGLPSPAMLRGRYVSSVVIQDGSIIATFGNQANSEISGQRLVFAPHAGITSVNWTCDSAAGTTLDQRFRPEVCLP